MSTPVRIAVDAGNQLGEGVLWCDRRQVLLWTDIARAELWEFEPANGATRIHAMPERLASFALCEADGWLLLALASRIAFYHLPSGELRPLHAVEPGRGTRANDGACDRQGRFVFGTLHEPASGDKQAVGAFHRLGHDLSLHRLPLPAVAISNSIAFSPDGGVMYFCDSTTGCIQCCDYGDTPGAVRTFVDLAGLDGEPDGSCVDAEGGLWNAQWGMGRVVRYAADGDQTDVIALPATQVTRPAFGGAGLDTLFVTSARDGLAVGALHDQPHAGALFAAVPGARGLPEARFAGNPDAAPRGPLSQSLAGAPTP
ncbi:MAG TPA: SMP-30/gluconolactonase/LRE family protein [Luteimonas sp.]|nr:SMP-30/gluconolactonase/LRE family protein [Luteimonas sp.]